MLALFPLERKPEISQRKSVQVSRLRYGCSRPYAEVAGSGKQTLNVELAGARQETPLPEPQSKSACRRHGPASR